MVKRRDFVLSTTAFIDVMACGLGAVLLLFVLVEFNSGLEPSLASTTEQKEVPKKLGSKEELDDIENQINDLANSIASLEIAILEREASAKSLQQKIDAREGARVVTEPPPPVSKENDSLSGQLIGLKVSSQNITILLDISASMYSPKIEEALYYSIAPSTSLAKTSEKWSQAKRIVSWLIDAAPDNASIRLGVFNEKAKPIWSTQLPKKEARARAAEALPRLTPKGATNLEEGLKWAALNPRYNSSIYIITDGLPTQPKPGNIFTRSLNECRSDPKGFVSGSCRLKIFTNMVGQARLGSAVVNTILLPLEGDPLAAPAYWELSKSTGGIVFTPDRFWP